MLNVNTGVSIVISIHQHSCCERQNAAVFGISNWMSPRIYLRIYKDIQNAGRRFKMLIKNAFCMLHQFMDFIKLLVVFRRRVDFARI